MSAALAAFVAAVEAECPAPLPPAWRVAVEASAGADPRADRGHVELAIEWMWSALAREDVREVVPEVARAAWDAMLAERTFAAATRAGDIARITHGGEVAFAAVDAAFATGVAMRGRVGSAVEWAVWAVGHAATATGDRGEVWAELDPAGLLNELIRTVADDGGAA